MIKNVIKTLVIMASVDIELASGLVKKEIPEHLIKKYGVTDPKVDKRVYPNLSIADIP